MYVPYFYFLFHYLIQAIGVLTSSFLNPDNVVWEGVANEKPPWSPKGYSSKQGRYFRADLRLNSTTSNSWEPGAHNSPEDLSPRKGNFCAIKLSSWFRNKAPFPRIFSTFLYLYGRTHYIIVISSHEKNNIAGNTVFITYWNDKCSGEKTLNRAIWYIHCLRFNNRAVLWK